MLRRSCVAFLGLLVLHHALGYAADIQIGGVPYKIPVPQGFVEVPSSHDLYRGQASIVATPGAHMVAMFAEKQEIDTVAHAEDLKRSLIVFLVDNFEYIKIDDADFLWLKDKLDSDTEDRAPFRFKLAAVKREMVPLRPFLEGKHWIAIPTFLKSTETHQTIGCASSVALNLRGKVIFLLISGGPEDMAWNRDTVRAWVSQIESANSAKSINYTRLALAAIGVSLLLYFIWRRPRKHAGHSTARSHTAPAASDSGP